MTEPKLCRECRWMNEYAHCENPAIPLYDLVNGHHRFWHCEVARRSEALCGFEGRHFEAKP